MTIYLSFICDDGQGVSFFNHIQKLERIASESFLQAWSFPKHKMLHHLKEITAA